MRKTPPENPTGVKLGYHHCSWMPRKCHMRPVGLGPRRFSVPHPTPTPAHVLNWWCCILINSTPRGNVFLYISLYNRHYGDLTYLMPTEKALQSPTEVGGRDSTPFLPLPSQGQGRKSQKSLCCHLLTTVAQLHMCAPSSGNSSFWIAVFAPKWSLHSLLMLCFGSN